VYLHDAISRFGKVHRVPGAPFSFVAFPLLRGETSQQVEGEPASHSVFNRFLSLGALDSEPLEKFSDLTHKALISWRKRFLERNLSTLASRDLFLHITKEGRFDLEQAPPTSYLETSYLAITNGLAKRYADESERFALELIHEYWLNPSLHPCEYIDFGDLPTVRLESVLEDYEHYANPIVQLFETTNEEDPQDPGEGAMRDDVIKFWKTYSPENLSSNCGGQLFKPRPQAFDTLEEFFLTFRPDGTEMNNCPTDGQGLDGSQDD
jgi:hypothetical protein